MVRKGPGEAGTSGSWGDCAGDVCGGGSAGEGGAHGAALWVVPLRSPCCPG